MRTLVAFVLLTGFAAVQSTAQGPAKAAPAAGPALDYETYRTKVEPVFLKKRPGHARCIVCHEGARTALQLQALPEGQGKWTEEQSRKNFSAVSRLVNAKDLMQSPLLKHPLAEEAGGDDFHSCGRQFASQTDPDWKAIADWARGAK
ncbi:MAG: hypothetical protein ABI995_00230 [Acidobacteriota bacterium]